jgi:multimeric flavodoxin WrbA
MQKINPINELLKSRMADVSPGNKILGIGGSPRKNGNSDVLLRYILKGAAQGNAITDCFQLREIAFQGCVGCEMCRRDEICTGLVDGMSLIYPQIVSSKGLILVSPTHNYNITSWMKAFIDRLYCFYEFQNTRPRDWSSRLAGQDRKSVIGAICEQEDKADMGFTLDAMRMPIEALGYEVIGELAVFKIFDKGRVKEDPDLLKKATQLGRNLTKAIG